MITHAMLWRAIEKLAEQNGTTCSGLARMGGLDITVFNKSKRFTSTGKQRWMSTFTLVKVLDATNTSMHQFAKLLEEEK